MRWRPIIEEQMRRPVSRQAAWFLLLTTLPAMAWETMAALRNWLYDRGFLPTRRLPGITVAVGNLEVGGTGKTPCVSLLASRLAERGMRPVILTRGYGVKIPGDQALLLRGGQLVGTKTGAGWSGSLPDEARMLSARCPAVPVVVAPRRWSGAQWLMAKLGIDGAPTHWLLDDGMQHRALRRDVNVVVMSSEHPYGNGWCLPRGTLREGMGGLWRGSLIVTTGSRSHAELGVALPQFAMTEGSARLSALSSCGLEPLDPAVVNASESWAIVTAIARPERVVETLRRHCGIAAAELVTKQDHSSYGATEVAAVLQRHPCIVTTDKDYWRHPEVWHSAQGRVFVLSVEWEIDTAVWAHILPENK